MQITLPYKFTPREYQLPFLQACDAGAKRGVIVWNRRSGKDKVFFNYLVKRAFEDVGTYFYLLPTYSQAKRVIWDNIDNNGFRMLDHIPNDLIREKNKSELKIELKNGSVIQLIAADTFSKSNVGTNPKGVMFSEYSISNPEAWQYISPILAANGGFAFFNFTPRGTNHAHTLLELAKKNGWFVSVLTIDDTQVITRDQYEEEIRNGLPRDIAEQEYLCKFIEGGASFFRGVSDVVDDNLSTNFANPERWRRYQIGVDLARSVDYTVITVIDLHTFDIVRQTQLDHVEWDFQKETIRKEALFFNNSKIVIDSTGVGDPIFLDLQKSGLDIIGFKINETSRNQLLYNLKIMVELKKIHIPNIDDLVSQLKSMTFNISGAKMKPMVPDGLHDDRIFSLALAVWGLSEKLPTRNEEREFMRELRANKARRNVGAIKLKMA